jgi:hypothetical protein
MMIESNLTHFINYRSRNLSKAIDLTNIDSKHHPIDITSINAIDLSFKDNTIDPINSIDPNKRYRSQA